MTELGLRISSFRRKSVRGILKPKMILEKLLQKSILMFGNKSSVPEDVKEGHFAVIAEDGEELKRFVVPLNCLKNPAFLRLLEEAAEEYGFDQVGALTIPCRPSELESVIGPAMALRNNWVVNHTDT